MSAFPKDAGNDSLVSPEQLTFPTDWTLSTSWHRAQTAESDLSPVSDASWMVHLGNGGYHRVTFALESSELVADCDCQGWTYNDFCAHVARLWWLWSRGELVVHDLDTESAHHSPPLWLRVDTEGK